MKKIFLLLALFSAVIVQAQNPIPILQPYKFLKYILVHDSVRANIYFQGDNDTMATRAYVRLFAGGGGIPLAGFGIKVGDDGTISIDSANYRKVDSLYPVTDSTFILKINSKVYSYKMRGAVFSFAGRIGAILPQGSDYAAFYTKIDSSYSDPSWLAALSFSKMINLPNTLAGYNILNAVTNAGGGYSLGSGPYNSRPIGIFSGSFYYATDTAAFYFFDGAIWKKGPSAGAGIGTLTGPLTPGTFLYAQTTNKAGAAPLINDTTNSRIQINVPVWSISTGASIFDKGNTAQRPSSPVAGMIRYNTDSSGYEQYTGAAWVKFGISIPGIGLGTVTQVNTGYGLSGGPVTSSGTILVDTTLLIPWNDTANPGPLVTKTFLTARGFLTTETDPVAVAKTVSLNQTTGAGVTVTGTTTQALGGNPTWTVKADTAILATKFYVNNQGFLSVEADPVAVAKNVTINQVANAGVLVTGTAAQTLGSGPTWTIKADTALVTTKYYVNSQGFLKSEADPIAVVKTISAVQSTGILITGAASQALSGNPSHTFKADTTLLATKWFVGQNVTNFTNMAAVDATAAITGVVNIQGYYTPGDGGGGGFYFVPGSTATAVPGMVIVVTGGRLFRLYQGGAVDIRWFGTKGDGTTNDATAFNAAVNFKPGFVYVPTPANFYRLSSQIGMNLSNVKVIGQDIMDTKIVVDSNNIKSGFFIGYNTHHISLESMNIVNLDTAKTINNNTAACIRVQMDTAFDGIETRRTHHLIFKNLRLSGYKGKTAGIALVAHRSGKGGTIDDVLTDGCLFDSLGTFGWGVLGEGGTTKSRWYYNMTVQNCRVRHTGLVDSTNGFGIDFGGQGSNNLAYNNYISDAVPIAIEVAGPSSTRLSGNFFDSCNRNSLTTFGLTAPYTFDCGGISPGYVGSDNSAYNNTTLDSFPSGPIYINQIRFTSTGNVLKAYGGGGYVDTLLNSKFTGDTYINTSTGSTTYVLWLRQHTSNNSFTGCQFIGVPTQQAIILAQDTAFNNIMDNCVFDGEKDSSTIILQSRGAVNNIAVNAIRASKKTPLYAANVPAATNPVGTFVQDANGGMALVPYGAGSKIGLVDSLPRVANGLQILGQNIYGQTSDLTHVGFMSIAQAKQLDSLCRGLITGKIYLGHPGAGGIWSGAPSPHGDSLYMFNLVAGTGMSITAASDSGRTFAVNTAVVATTTNTLTMTNKTLTAPQINSAKLNTTSAVGYVWTATGTDGSGGWAASAGGGGSQNLGQGTITGTTVPLTISGGTGTTLQAADHSNAGLIKAISQARLDSTIYFTWSGKGKKPLHFSYTKDTATFLGLGITGSKGLTAVYTGTPDSVSFDVQFSLLTTAGDQMIGGASGVPTRVAAGTNGQVWTMVSGSPAWANVSGTGTVTSFSITHTVGTLFTNSLATATSTPAVTTTLTAAPANAVWGSVAGGTPGYFNPSLTSSLFANEGTVNTVPHGNAAGNMTFAPVNIVNDVTGVLAAAQFPILGGVISTPGNSLTTSFVAGSVNTAALANAAVDLTTKVTGIGSPANGFTGVNNGTKTITLGGNLVTGGAFGMTLRATNTTDVTFPVSGTLLAQNGNGSALTNIVAALSPVANQTTVSNTGTSFTVGTVQDIGTGSSPTFTHLSLTGLAAGATSDNIMTIASGVIRTLPASTFVLSSAVNSATYTSTLTGTTNVGALTFKGASYIQVGNQVEVTLSCFVTASDPSGLVAVTFSLPITTTTYSGPTTQAYIGSGTAFVNTTYVPVMVNNLSSTTTGVFSFITGDTNMKAVSIKFMYTL